MHVLSKVQQNASELVLAVRDMHKQEKVNKMKFYTYSQNNSGGYFIDNERVCEYLIIEAETVKEANARMEEITADYREYCECCGERWHECWDEDDGKTYPNIYGVPVERVTKSLFRNKAYLYRHGSDTQEVFVFEEEKEHGKE